VPRRGSCIRARRRPAVEQAELEFLVCWTTQGPSRLDVQPPTWTRLVLSSMKEDVESLERRCLTPAQLLRPSGRHPGMPPTWWVVSSIPRLVHHRPRGGPEMEGLRHLSIGARRRERPAHRTPRRIGWEHCVGSYVRVERALRGVKEKVLNLLLVVLAFAACDLPRDPEKTLDRVMDGVVRVGVTESPPWVVLGSGEPGGVEVEVVRLLADQLDATIEWTEGSTDDLAAAVYTRELDLMIGGLTSTSKISSEATLTHPYVTTQIVVAAPRGFPVEEDITGVEVAVEEGTEAAGILEKTDAIPRRVTDLSLVEGPVAVESYLLDDFDLQDTGVRLLESDHVMAVPHGENDWLVEVERFLLTRSREINSILEAGDQA
jgi:polar amino acid transport system substrate-binding protein